MGSYSQAILREFPMAYWRLGERESYAQMIRRDAFAFWRLNEPSGTVFSDSSATHSFPGVINGGVTVNQAGALSDSDKAMLFNGTTGYLSFTANLTGLSGLMSFEAWINPSSLSGTKTIFSAVTSTSFFTLVGNQPNISLNIGGVTRTLLGSGISGPSIWHHVVATWDNDKLRMYIDGALSSTSASFGPGAVSLGTGTHMIGQFVGTGSFWSGLLDEVAIYGIALTDTQINARYLLRTVPYTDNVAPVLAVDSTGFSAPGVYKNGVVLGQPSGVAGTGDDDTSAFFNNIGSGSSVDVTNAILYRQTDISIEAWVSSLEFTIDRAVIRCGTGVNAMWWMAIGAGGSVVSGHYKFGSAIAQFVTTATGLVTSGWHHLVVTRATDGKTYKIYVDGVLVLTQATADVPTTPAAQLVQIGRSDAAADLFSGWIDEVALYAYALSPGQVAAHYAQGLTNPVRSFRTRLLAV